MSNHYLRSDTKGPIYNCLTYCQLPYNGQGPSQSCVSLLENFSSDFFEKTLLLPRAIRPIRGSINVKQTLPYPIRYFPWRAISSLGNSSLNNYFSQAIDAAEPENSVAYFWPDPPLSLVRRARDRGLLTVREMINTFRGTAKTILDHAYDRLGHVQNNKITQESVEREREELSLYDHIFASNDIVEASLLEAGVNAAQILPTSFGWSPSRFRGNRTAGVKKGFRALFVGTLCIRKGVPQLLAAWKQSGVVGELVMAGRVEEGVKVLLEPYLNDNSVRVIDFSPDIGNLYHSADLFIFPTLEEGGPQVVYEAAGCGLPILTTPMGVGRLVKDGVNGLVVEANNIDDLAAAILRMATFGELRNRLARQATIDARQFTYEKVGLYRSAKLKCILDERTIG